MNITIIAALTPTGAIGRTSKPCDCAARTSVYDPHAHRDCQGTYRDAANDLPWGRDYPEDLARVEALTMGHAVIMGRRTWESIGAPLPGRTNVVVSKSMYIECLKEAVDHRADWKTRGHFPDVSGGAHVFIRKTLAEAVERLSWPKPNRQYEKLFIIGGARLFAEALPLADTLELTLIGREYEGDVRFPDAGPNHWQSSAAIYKHIRIDCYPYWGEFACTACTRCPTNADLTFTTWVRR